MRARLTRWGMHLRDSRGRDRMLPIADPDQLGAFGHSSLFYVMFSSLLSEHKQSTYGTLTAPPSHSTASFKNSFVRYLSFRAFHSSSVLDGTNGLGCGHKSLSLTKSISVSLWLVPICLAVHRGANVYRARPAKMAVRSTQKPVLRRRFTG